MSEQSTGSEGGAASGKTDPSAKPPAAAIAKELSPQTIESIVEIQRIKVQNEASNLAFKEKELAANVELSKKAMDMDLELERKKPGEQRKTMVYAGGTIAVFLLIILGFLGWCLQLGKEQFVVEFIKYALYPTLAGGGYWVGSRRKKKKNKSNSGQQVMQDADVVDDD